MTHAEIARSAFYGAMPYAESLIDEHILRRRMEKLQVIGTDVQNLDMSGYSLAEAIEAVKEMDLIYL